MCVCVLVCASSYSRRVVPCFSSSHGHDVVHLPFLSGLAGVTVRYEHFVEQVGAVQTFACWETTYTSLTACDTGGEAAGGLLKSCFNFTRFTQVKLDKMQVQI